MIVVGIRNLTMLWCAGGFGGNLHLRRYALLWPEGSRPPVAMLWSLSLHRLPFLVPRRCRALVPARGGLVVELMPLILGLLLLERMCLCSGCWVLRLSMQSRFGHLSRLLD